MKYITIAILWMLLATPALACVRTYDVEADRVDSFPIMGYIDELDSRDEIYFTIYIRETGNFEGLSGVSSEIKNAEGSELFSGALHMSRTDNEGLFRVGFRVGKEILEQGTLTVTAEKRDRAEQETDNGTVVSVHTTIYLYRFNLKMLYTLYVKNDFSKHSQQDNYHGPKLEALLEKEFELDRDSARDRP